MSTSEEEWRPIADVVEGYEISDLGRLRSYRSMGRTDALMASPRIIGGSVLKNGYIAAHLPEGFKQRRRRYIHELVCAAFVGPRPPGAHVAHGNGIKTDNRLVNLRYASPTENSMDRVLHGTMLYGEDVWMSVLTSEQVCEIRQRYGPYRRYGKGMETQRALAAEFGVVQQTIQRIVAGHHWHHIDAAA